MRPLGEHLSRRGFTVLAPRLCGHGTTPEDLRRTTWPDWYNTVLDGYHLLAALCEEVAAVGLSMGGLLALLLGCQQPVSRVAALSAPIILADRRLPFLPVYRWFRSYVKKPRSRWIDEHITYDRMPVQSIDSLLDLIKHVDGKLPSFTKPLLVMQSRVEHTVRPESARHILRRAGSMDKQLVWLERSGHLITLDVEQDRVFAEVAAFLEKEAGESLPAGQYKNKFSKEDEADQK